MPMQLYKLPGGTEPVKKWKLMEDVPITPDRPEVNTQNHSYTDFS